MKTVNLTIAGTCTGDSGRGGWAFVLRMGEHSIERTDGSPLTTKAQMELNAVTEGLKALRERCQVYLFSDNRRLRRWHRPLARGVADSVHPSERALALHSPRWRPVEKLDALADMHQISGRCIVGQVGYPDKARCEELAESQAKLNAGVPCKRSLAGKAAQSRWTFLPIVTCNRERSADCGSIPGGGIGGSEITYGRGRIMVMKSRDDRSELRKILDDSINRLGC